jgi:hypothetical protein
MHARSAVDVGDNLFAFARMREYSQVYSVATKYLGVSAEANILSSLYARTGHLNLMTAFTVYARGHIMHVSERRIHRLHAGATSIVWHQWPGGRSGRDAAHLLPDSRFKQVPLHCKSESTLLVRRERRRWWNVGALYNVLEEMITNSWNPKPNNKAAYFIVLNPALEGNLSLASSVWTRKSIESRECSRAMYVWQVVWDSRWELRRPIRP